ncbi:hypothetical protein TUM4644_07370 [Shewanella colwelliana]|uniref:hypothetical protein n=1 Tax=Shewanella colwelliana TaxID=23 RepID=UPI001BBF265C|nr:hypothetical protein [Shewanella colwelliana]GIU19499.1 hypothetical protein TUM4644_07370 [Shewanella colwelliana]
MLFDLLYGWRKWRGQRGIWLVLILSLCLLCSLIGLVSSLLWMLNSDRPQWVMQHAPVITVVNQDFNGNLQPTSVYDIELLQNLPTVTAVASVAVQTTMLTVGLQDIPNLKVGFYSDSLIDVMGLPKPFSHSVWEGNKVVLSAEFWREHTTTQSVSELSLYFKDRSLAIAGIAPTSMAKIGDVKIDVWIPDRYLLQDVPTMFANNPDLYIKTKSNRYGFALLSRAAAISELQQAYSLLRSQTPRPEGGFVDSHYTPWLIDGVELKPNERALIKKQAWVLLVLLICFGFIVCSGIVSVYTQQSIVRQSEVQLKIALGGSRLDLFGQLFRENLLSLLMLIVVSPLLGFIFMEYVAKIPVYRAYFDSGLSFNSWLWLGAVLGSACLYLTCAQIPMFNAMKTQFRRGRVGQMTKAQVLMSQLVLVMQLTVIISVATLCLVLSSSQWSKYQKVSFAESLYSLKPKVTGRLSMSLSSEQINGDWLVASNEVALSSEAFTQLGAQSLSYRAQSTAVISKPINSLYVSTNFFDLLEIPFLIPATLTTDSVIINQTMALQLAEELGLSHWQGVKGVELQVLGFYYEKQLKVAGVIEDQLHFGINQAPRPVIYLHLGTQNPLIAHRLAPVIYSKGENVRLVESHLNDWAKLQSSVLSYQYAGQLNQEIINTDSAGRLLFVTSCVMALLISLLVMFTLYYRFYFAVKVQQVKWAVLLALGGRKANLVVQTIRLNIVLAGIAGVCAVLLLFSLDAYSMALLSISLIQPLLLGISLITCVLMIVGITCWVSLRTFRHSISHLLRS